MVYVWQPDIFAPLIAEALELAVRGAQPDQTTTMLRQAATHTHTYTHTRINSCTANVSSATVAETERTQ